MKHFILSLALSVVFPALGAYQVGETVRNMCWKDAENKQVCLDDYKDTVRVLLYNAGWCGPCNQEFAELSSQVKGYSDQPVTFISLSSSGWRQSQPASPRFLREWREKHDISFIVAASPHDAGTNFIEPPIFIPNVAIIAKNGTLSYAATSPGVERILHEVRTLLDLR